MKRILLFALSIALWMGFVNAQVSQNDNAKNFHRQTRDSSFNRSHANGFKPGAPGDQMRRPGNGQFAGRFNQQMHQRRAGMMARLRLTPDQLKQSKAINEEYRNQLADLQKKDKISLGEYKSQLAALHKDHKAKLQGILTDEQRNKIAVAKKNAEINAHVNSVARLERLKLTLGLSDDQVATIKSNQEALHNKIKAIHENEALLPEQKKEQLKSLMEQQKDIVKSVLTPEQQSKTDSLRKNMMNNNWNRNNRPAVK
jgi:opacity protein-like surface antigen